MKHLFVPYELAVKAKKNNFNEECFSYYGIHSKAFFGFNGKTYCNGSMDGFDGHSVRAAAPLYQQLVDWFREEHKIHVEPFSGVNNWKTYKPYTVYRVQKFGSKKNYREYHKKTINEALYEAFELI